MIDDIEIFRPGTHTDNAGARRSFSAEDVAAIAAGYDAAVHPAPIVVGHPKTDDPAFGWVASLRVRPDGILVARPKQVAPEFADAVKAGRYKRVSASFYLPDAAANPTPGRYALRHVGFLGAAAPAVKGLRPVELSADDADAMTTIEFDEHSGKLGRGIAQLMRSLRDLLVERFGVDAVDRALPDAAIGALDELAAAQIEEERMRTSFADEAKGEAGIGTGPAARREIDRLTDAGMTLVAISTALGRLGPQASRSPGVLALIRDGDIANPPDSLIEFLRRIEPPEETSDNASQQEDALSATEKERLEALEKENAALKAEAASFAEAQARARRTEDKVFIDGLVKEGKLAPGVAPDVLAFMAAIDGEEAIAFSEDRRIAPLAFFRDLLGKAGTVIDFAERSAPGKGGDVEDNPVLEAHRRHYGMSKEA